MQSETILLVYLPGQNQKAYVSFQNNHPAITGDKNLDSNGLKNN